MNKESQVDLEELVFKTKSKVYFLYDLLSAEVAEKCLQSPISLTGLSQILFEIYQQLAEIEDVVENSKIIPLKFKEECRNVG